MKFLATGIAPAARIAMIPSAMINSSKVKPASIADGGLRIADCGLPISANFAIGRRDVSLTLVSWTLIVTICNPQSAIRNPQSAIRNPQSQRLVAAYGELNDGSGDGELIGPGPGSGLATAESDLRLAFADGGEFDRDQAAAGRRRGVLRMFDAYGQNPLLFFVVAEVRLLAEQPSVAYRFHFQFGSVVLERDVGAAHLLIAADFDRDFEGLPDALFDGLRRKVKTHRRVRVIRRPGGFSGILFGQHSGDLAIDGFRAQRSEDRIRGARL